MLVEGYNNHATQKYMCIFFFPKNVFYAIQHMASRICTIGDSAVYSSFIKIFLWFNI